jgi:hypothetical protein
LLDSRYITTSAQSQLGRIADQRRDTTGDLVSRRPTTLSDRSPVVVCIATTPENAAIPQKRYFDCRRNTVQNVCDR